MPVSVGNKIYVHMPKTGGTWVSKYLIENCGGVDIHGNGHMPASKIPKLFSEGKSVFGTVRNPWDWYASWWLHATNMGPDCMSGLSTYGGGETDFASVLSGVLSPVPDRTPDQPGVMWSVAGPKSARNRFLRSGMSLYTWSFHHIYDKHPIELVDISSLKSGVDAVVGVYPDECPPPTNTNRSDGRSKHVDEYKSMYRKGMINDVLYADQDLISLIGYEEPFEGPRVGLISL